jgi:dynein heavy chain
VEDLIHKVMEYRSSFDTYAYLWVDDRTTFMREFLLYNHSPLNLEEHDLLAEGNLPERPPTLNQFKGMVWI